MNTTVRNSSPPTERHTKNHTPFNQWLAEIKPDFPDIAKNLISANQLDSWFLLLETAQTEQDISPALNRLNLSARTLAQLFDITHKQLPEQTLNLYKSLSQIQNRVMIAATRAESAETLSATQLKVLAQLSKHITQNSHSNQLMQEIVTLIAPVFRDASINLFRLKEHNTTLSCKAGLWKNGEPKPVEQAIFAKQLIKTENNAVKKTITTQKAHLNFHPGYTTPPAMENIAAEIAAPLFKKNRLIGIIHVLSHTTNQLNRQSVLFLEAAATQISLLLENARLYATVQRQNHYQQVLLETNAALASKLESNKVLELLSLKITETLNAGACIISRWDKKTLTLTAIAEYVRPKKDNPRRTWRNLNQPMSIKQDALGQQVMQTMHPLVNQYQAGQTAQKAPVWTKYGWQSILAFPLQQQNKKLGLVEVYHQKAGRTFTKEDIQIGQALASQAAIAVSRIESLQQIQQRLVEVSAMYTLSHQLISTSALDLTQTLNNIVISMRQIVDCRACVLFLFNPKNQSLEIKAASGLKTHWKKNARLAIGEGAAGKAVAEKRTIYIPDTLKDPDFIFFDHTIRSLIVVPLVFQNQVLGAINLDDTHPNAFGKSQERLLSIAANQSAIAIQNGTLLQKIISEEQRTQAIIQHMADGLLMINQSGDIVQANPALTTILGLYANRIIGKNIKDKHLPPELKSICQPLHAEQRTGVLSKEITLSGKNGITLKVFGSTVTDKNREPIGEVRVVHDVTQEKELERMKDDFISTVSHELRTPLFSIQGFVQLILSGDVKDHKTQDEFLSIIERQANQLAELVTNLLDLNRLSTGALTIDKKNLQLLDVIQQTLRQMHGFAHKKKVVLSSRLPANLPLIYGDAQRLEQILTNLIGNAIKFTPIGGKVHVTAYTHQQHIIISIADTGIGIAPKEMKRIFSKFYQVEEHSTRSFAGSGLGLYISRQLIEKHNGNIWAKSQLGKGSTFYIQIPIIESPTEP